MVFLVGVCFFVYYRYFRILQSETYEVLDTLFYDEATSSKHKTDYTNNGLSVDYDSTGTVLTNNTTTTQSYYLNYTL